MSGIYYVLIVLPILILVILAFIFQSSVQEIKGQQFLLNCPYPISNGVASNTNIIDTRLNYTVNYGSGGNFSSHNYNGTFFECHITSVNPLLLGASTIVKNYGATFFNIIPYGWYAWVGDTISVAVGKVQPFLTMVYLMFTAPTQVTGLAWFTYVQVFLLFMIGTGIFMAIRGS